MNKFKIQTLILIAFSLTLLNCSRTEESFRELPPSKDTLIAGLIGPDSEADFGNVIIENSKTLILELNNVGAAQAQISQIKNFAKNKNFEFEGGIWPGIQGSCNQSMIIESKEKCSISVSFNPTNPGIIKEKFNINYNNGFKDLEIIISLKGVGIQNENDNQELDDEIGEDVIGEEETIITNQFIYSGEQERAKKLDILWVIDDSRSMTNNQKMLSDNLDLFIENLLQQTYLDIKMGIVTTDLNKLHLNGLVAPHLSVISNPDSTSFYQGENQLISTETYLAKDKFMNIFRLNAIVGIRGSGVERGLYTAHDALCVTNQENTFSTNFVRSNQQSSLAVIIISDEDERSDYSDYDNNPARLTTLGRTAQENINNLKKRYPGIKVFTIVNKSTSHPNSTHIELPTYVGHQYMQISRATSAQSYDIRDHFGSNLVEISDTLKELMNKFTLSQKAIPDSISIIATKNEINYAVDFVYDETTNSIELIGEMPPEQSNLIMTYKID